MSDKHLLLVDASGIAYRAFYTSSPIHRASDGQPIGAVLRFMSITWRLLGAAEADKPTHGAAVFDVPGPNFRHKIWPSYKSNRDPARGLILYDQIPYMRHAAETMGLYPVEAEGFEADDVIATLAEWARACGWRVTIVSSDKDFGQLVKDGEIEIVDPMQKRRVLAADVEKKFGVPPGLVADVQALAGDPVDGYPGIKGCGKKYAGGLVRAYGGLERVIKNLSRVQPIGVRHALSNNKDKARLFKELAVLRKDVPLPNDLYDRLELKPVLKSHLLAILKALEAEPYMQMVFGLDPQTVRLVDPAKADPYAWWKEELKFPGQVPLPDVPQCGFYQRTLIRGGPMVAARIWRTPHLDAITGEPTGREFLHCMVGGRARDPYSEWARIAYQPIKESDYHYEIADAEHARKWRADDPKATPHKRPDLLKAKAPINPRKRRA